MSPKTSNLSQGNVAGSIRLWPQHLVGLLLLLSLPFLSISPTYAATITVTTTTDELNNDGDCSLREAIRAANLDQAVDACPAGSGADTINLPAGIYTLAIPGLNENAAQTGDLDLTGEVTITGAGLGTTIVDGAGLDRLFEVTPNSIAHISGLTLTGGLASTGGAIFVGINSDLSLTDSQVSQNQSNGNGGGIFIGNGTVTISNSWIDDNAVGLFNGGGIYLASGTLILSNSQVDGNQASSGGGIFVNTGTAQITNSQISHNSATFAHGGGIYTLDALTLVNSTISGNQAVQDGGGIYLSGGVTALYNVTVAANTADSDGDDVGDGGGFRNPASYISAKNSLFADNEDSSSPGNREPDCSGTLTNLGYNLVESTTGCNFFGDLTGNLTGFKPLLGPLQNNGGLTLTHALLATSPAINAANLGGCLDQDDVSLTTDQRGFVRLGLCDIGAFEANSPGPPTATPTKKSTATTTNTPTATHTVTTINTTTATPTASSTHTAPPSLTPTATDTATAISPTTPTATVTAISSITPSPTGTITSEAEPPTAPTAIPTMNHQIFLPLIQK